MTTGFFILRNLRGTYLNSDTCDAGLRAHKIPYRQGCGKVYFFYCRRSGQNSLEFGRFFVGAILQAIVFTTVLQSLSQTKIERPQADFFSQLSP
ncbi:MAG TPA: hypothetical protein DCG06_07120 [Deltaproteobacteria bacterium]|nr:hypothetical protein [Deltaproteobacteria bacterium]